MMKCTAITRACCLVAAAILLPLVATFAPDGLLRHRSMNIVASLRMALEDEVPDIVKAYKKVKPQLKVPEVSLPTTPELPVVVEPEPVVTISLPDPPSLPSPPDVNVQVELPSAPDMSEIQSSVSESMEAMQKSLPSLKETAESVNAQFQGLNEFFKATQAQAAARAAERAASATASTGGGKLPTLAEMIARRTEASSSVVLPQVKAPTLVEYLGNGFQSPTATTNAETLMESKVKLIQLLDNIYSLTGQSSSLNGASTIDSLEAISRNLPGDMSPETATAIGAATFGVLVIAGQNNKSKTSKDSTVPALAAAAVTDQALLESEDGPMSALAKDVKKMATQIQALSDETKKLRRDVKDAQENLMRKDLEMGKERLKAADKELQLKREIQKVTLKLQESEAKSKALEKELEATMDVKETLKTALTKIKQLEDQLQASQVAAATTVVEAPVPAPEPVAPEPVAPEPQPEPAVPEVEPVAVVEEPAPAPKKPPTKQASAKKSAGPKGGTAKAVTPDEEPSSPSPAPKKVPKSKKAKSKAKSRAKETPETAPLATNSDDDGDWSSLSATTLTRKTVKELTDYLSDKGVPTNDDDGKPLKKALLVEAVQAL